MQCNPEVAGVQNIKFYVQGIHEVAGAQQSAMGGTFHYFTQKRDW